MCEVCDDTGFSPRCPVCGDKPPRIVEFHCLWCGRDFPEEDDEEIQYKDESYCRECYGYKKDEESIEEAFLTN
ncbi:MAG: hypothetical protein LBL07_05675 [Tannerella sp.]|jgi:DNA-directed RNA polymerase subunit RPC12/RpoP|nr:hypothetical protein [Tannerella sp.]